MSLFLLVACDELDGFDIPTNNIHVVESKGTDISAKGGEATITLDCAPKSVYATDSWLKVSSDGLTVRVSAPANDSREKRNAMVIMKASDADSTMVNVSQEGLVFGYFGDRVVVHSYKETDIAVSYLTNDPDRVRIVSQPDWIETQIVGDSLKMHIAENRKGSAIGDLRFGYVTFGIDEKVDTVKVIQYYWTNLRGKNNWLLLGYGVTFDADGSYYINQESSSYLKADLAFFGTQATFTIPEFKIFSNLPAISLTLKTELDYNTLSFSFSNGQFMGNYGDSIYLAETLIGATMARSFSTAPTARFVLDVDDSGMLWGRISGEFPTDGGNLDIIGLWLCAFRRQEFSYDAYYGQGQGDIWGLMPCWLIKPVTE